MPTILAVLAERTGGERRVALVPEVASRLIKLGAVVRIQSGAGVEAGFPDTSYADCHVLPDAQAVLAGADVLLTVQPPDPSHLQALAPGATVVGFLQPHARADLLAALQQRRLTAFAMERIPRISRAQAMDALSSQALVAGYKGVLLAAQTLDKFFPMFTTAAGTIRPAQVLVIGAGVAGLQAIATARRLGAVVEAYDVRAATREQVMSLGAKFVETGVSADGEGGYARELTADERAQQQQALEARVALADAVVTTAAIPGRQAPRILSRAAVEGMKAGSVIVDLAAESGGNCELTRPGETVEHAGVRILGPLNLPAQLAQHASSLYARNLLNFLQPALRDGRLAIDWDDEIFRQAAVVRDGEILHAHDAATLADRPPASSAAASWAPSLETSPPPSASSFETSAQPPSDTSAEISQEPLPRPPDEQT